METDDARADGPLATCAACGFITLQALPGSGERCGLCGWIDDFEQLVHPDIVYGENSGVSLRQAQRKSLRTYPASSLASGELRRDPQWRPLSEAEVPSEAAGPSSPVCYLGTPDRDTYVPYWRRVRRTHPPSGD